MMPKSSAMKRGLALARRIDVDPDVAGVRVGVEEVVAEHLRVEHAHALGRERLAVDAGGVERGDVVGRDAAHAFQRQRALGGVRPDHFRHVQVVASPARSGAARWHWRLRAAGRVRRRACSRSRPRSRAGGSCRRWDGCGRPARRSFFSSAMSPAICFSMSGRSTLTTTSRGGRRHRRGSVAACTCAIEADASGVVSKLANASPIGGPARARRSRARLSPSNGATRSCSSVSSSATSGGTRSRRVDRICPNLTKIGPSSCSARRRRAPRDCAAISRRGARHERPHQLQPALGRRVVEQVVEPIAQQHAADAPGAQDRLHARAPARARRRATRAARRSTSSRRASTSSWKAFSSARRDHVARFLGDEFGRVLGEVAPGARAPGAAPPATRIGDLHAEHVAEHRARTAAASPDRSARPGAAGGARVRHRRRCAACPTGGASSRRKNGSCASRPPSVLRTPRSGSRVGSTGPTTQALAVDARPAAPAAATRARSATRRPSSGAQRRRACPDPAPARG